MTCNRSRSAYSQCGTSCSRARTSVTSTPWRAASSRACVTTTPMPPLSCRSLTMKATFTGALARGPEGAVAPRAAAMVAAVIDPASAPRRTRVAFVGQATFFEACALGPGGHGFEPRFFEYRAGADANRLVVALRSFDPDVVLVFRPEIVPCGAFQDVRALTVGFLTEPLPRTARGAPVHDDLVKRLGELRKVDR